MPANIITFPDPRALCVFHSMAEGMEEVVRDNADPFEIARADALLRLIEETGYPDSNVPTFPYTVLLDAELVEAAEVVLENCLDNSSGMKPDDEDAEDCLFPGQVVIGGPPA